MKISRVGFAKPVNHGSKIVQSASIKSDVQLGVVPFESIELIEFMGFPCFVLKSPGRVTHHPFTAAIDFQVIEEPAVDPKAKK